MGTPPALLHGTVVAWEDRGILICGHPGEGKSSLALECIDHGAELVADDVVLIRPENEALTAFAPDTLQGCLALRELGILTFPFISEVKLCWVVELSDSLGRDLWMHEGLTLPRIYMPRHYPARLALLRTITHSKATWLPEDWTPLRRRA
jgi:hypothetical protein